MRHIIGSVGMMLPLVLAGSARLAAQGTTSITLKPALARLSQDFSRIVGLRELPDGRVLVADAIEKRVVVADFVSGTITEAAANGQGPTEFSNASAIWPLRGDTSLMADMSSRRWHVFVGSRLVGLVPPDHPAQSATGSSVLSTDTLGFVLARRSIQREYGAAYLGTLDSSLVVLVEFESGSIDTIATLAPGEGTMRTSGLVVNGRPQRIVFQFRVLSAGEQALLTPDGWIAVARRDPYRVDWRSPQRQWTHGPALPFTKIRVDEHEKKAYLKRGDRNAARTPPPGAALTWVSTLPPFEDGALISAPDGTLLIKRLPSADAPSQVYDVVDRSGRLVRKLDVDIGGRIVAFGRGLVYVVSVDEDGLERLARHPWP